MAGSLAGFDTHGIDRDHLEAGVIGTYLLFDDHRNMAVTIYFLNQMLHSKLVAGRRQQCFRILPADFADLVKCNHLKLLIGPPLDWNDGNSHPSRKRCRRMVAPSNGSTRKRTVRVR